METMNILKKNSHLFRYGLLFSIGVIFGSIGMFYRSFDITHNILETPQSYVWSETEQKYVPFQNNRLTYLAPSVNSSPSVQFVLILTYMRSGSSFTADVIQHYPGAFYSFEPLISIFHSKTVTYLNGTKRNFTTPGDIRKESIHILERWYNCDLYNLGVGSLKSLFMSFGIYTNEFYQCVGPKKRKADMIKCMPNLVKACKKSTLRVIKTIRVNVKDITEYLKKIPNFKLIHLVRDPRGVMNSRIKIEPKVYGGHKLAPSARTLCKEMADDLSNTFRLAKECSNRVTVLHYEDLAENPYSTTVRLYTFLNLHISLEIYGYVYHITSAGEKKERAYGISRSNSKSTANRWKKNLKYSEIKLIDSECNNNYHLLGYLPVQNSSVLNETSSQATRINQMKIPIKYN